MGQAVIRSHVTPQCFHIARRGELPGRRDCLVGFGFFFFFQLFWGLRYGPPLPGCLWDFRLWRVDFLFCIWECSMFHSNTQSPKSFRREVREWVPCSRCSRFLQVCLTFSRTNWNFLLYHDHNRSGEHAQVSVRFVHI